MGKFGLGKKNKGTEEAELPPLKFMSGDVEVDLGEKRGFARLVRRMLLSEGQKQRRKYAHLVHPESGERPTVVLHVEPKPPHKVTVRLVTDSQDMREWLKAQGIVIGEVVGTPSEAAKEPAASSEPEAELESAAARP